MRRTTATRHSPTFLSRPGEGAQTAFCVAAGIFFFIVVVKYGNPVILDLDSTLPPPKSLEEIIYESWPLRWVYWPLALFFALGLAAIRWKRPPPSRPPNPNPNPPSKPSPPPKTAAAPSSTIPIRPFLCGAAFAKVLLFLPLIWLAWQFMAAIHTITPALTAATLRHFSISVALFYLAYFALEGVENPWPLWAGLSLALACFIRTGFDQHFGGLEATRKMVREMPNFRALGADYLKRLNSDRIFGTYMYPNALAGGILFLLPLALAFVWLVTPKVGINGRRAFLVILGGCALACLYWSGSKAGWLVMLVLGLIVLLHSAISARARRWLVCGIVILGLTGFAVRHAKFFVRGSTSVVARFDYWAAALHTALEHPVFGTGPGSFSAAYRKVKKPESEMAQLCHNDYLEQASDSGLVGFASFSTMIFGILAKVYRCSKLKVRNEHEIDFFVWLGLVGLFLHSTVEFHLYYPAFAWLAFFLLGWMLGNAARFTENIKSI